MRRKSRTTTVKLFHTNLIISEFEQSGRRIRSRRQYKDQRSTAVGISECFAQIKWRRFNKLFTKLDGNKVLNCGRDLKGEHKTNLVFAKGNSILLMKSLAWHLKKGLAFRQRSAARIQPPPQLFAVFPAHISLRRPHNPNAVKGIFLVLWCLTEEMFDRSKILCNNYTTNSAKTQSFPSVHFPGDGDNARL